MTSTSTATETPVRLYKLAFIFSIVTIVYNLAEGIVSTIFGASDETLALFGFGLDSFIEVASGIGIAHMIWRIWRQDGGNIDNFEKTALRITGTAFYLLSASLVIGVALNIYQGAIPETTRAGVVISILSILTMYALSKAKIKVGKQLGSEPIIADGKCTLVCLYMSVVLLASSLLYELTGFAYADALGTLGIIWFSVKEGKEAFDKAKGKATCCGGSCQT